MLSLFLLLSCTNKKDIPSGIIGREKMEQVLWDLMRADQFLGNYVFTRDSSKDRTKESLLYYERIFRLHQTNREEFERSFAWYRTHPALFKDIMDSLSAPTLAGGQDMPAPVVTRPDTGVKKNVSIDTIKKKKSFIPVE
jgi:hypothetical protein